MAPTNDASRPGGRFHGPWARTVLHPTLPGEDLAVDEHDGRIGLFDPENPEAYVVGDGVEVGVRD